MYRYLENGSTLHLEPSKCTGCGLCIEVCPHAVFTKDGKAGTCSIVSISNRDGCMECGACSLNCPVQALGVRRGVGCAAAVWNGLKRGGEPSCDCGNEPCC